MSKKNEMIKIADTTGSKKFGLFIAILFLSAAVTFIGVNELYLGYKKRNGVQQALSQAPDYVMVLYGEPLMKRAQVSPGKAAELESQKASINLKYPYYNYRSNKNEIDKPEEAPPRRSIADFLRGR